MGWDTQITVLAERCGTKCVELAQAIYEQDAKAYDTDSYAGSSALTRGDVLFFTYERRKYLPYWVIEEISAQNPDVYFTVVASCPDFIGGPAGLVRITGGKITDSYGFWGTRKTLAESPVPEAFLMWFGWLEMEEQLRSNYEQPRVWCEERFAENAIEFTEEEEQELVRIMSSMLDAAPGWNVIQLR